MKIGDVVFIEWIDAISSTGWTNPDEVPNTAERCVSVGILHHQDDRATTIIQSAGADGGDVHNSITIPAAGIVQSTVLMKFKHWRQT